MEKKARALPKAAPWETMLVDGEELLVKGEIHAGIYWKSVALAIIGLLLLVKAFNLGVFLLLVAALMFALAYTTKRFLLLVLTNKRVIMRYGILRLDLIQIRLSRVETIESETTIPGQIMGYANVVITGTGTRNMGVPFLANASQFQTVFNALALEKEDGQ